MDAKGLEWELDQCEPRGVRTHCGEGDQGAARGTSGALGLIPEEMEATGVC